MDKQRAAAVTRALEACVTVEPFAGGPLRTVGLQATREIAGRFSLEPREVELAAVQAEIMPRRYQRNLGTVGWEGQARLLASCVAVVGCGGLGGWIVEGLARMGVGRLRLVDGDCYDEDNLNRQLGCLEETLGRPKVEVLAERIRRVNAATELRCYDTRLTTDNAMDLLDGVDLVVDALDNVPSRLDLEAAAEALGLPLVHGAVAGHMGQVTTLFPGDGALSRLYSQGAVPPRGVETKLGNPAATPMLVAAWELAEAVKILCGEELSLRRRLLFIDTLYGEVREIGWEPGSP